MLWRLLLAGVAWLAAIVLFAAALDTPAPAPPPTRTWSITQTRTAHHAMIVDVVADDVAEAPAIAAELVEQYRSRQYQEVLVYVRGPGRRGTAALHRVQWTAQTGFGLLVISE